jgi:probable rRNA maturation factor
MSQQVLVCNRQRLRPLQRQRLAALAHQVLRGFLQCPAYEVSITVLRADVMARLNEDYLHHEGPTDGITFGYGKDERSVLSADLFVCIDEALEQAPRFGSAWTTELVRYVVHGLLHASGYDDHTPGQRRAMRTLENRAIRMLGGDAVCKEIAGNPKRPSRRRIC